MTINGDRNPQRLAGSRRSSAPNRGWRRRFRLLQDHPTSGLFTQLVQVLTDKCRSKARPKRGLHGVGPIGCTSVIVTSLSAAACLARAWPRTSAAASEPHELERHLELATVVELELENARPGVHVMLSVWVRVMP